MEFATNAVASSGEAEPMQVGSMTGRGMQGDNIVAEAPGAAGGGQSQITE